MGKKMKLVALLSSLMLSSCNNSTDVDNYYRGGISMNMAEFNYQIHDFDKDGSIDSVVLRYENGALPISVLYKKGYEETNYINNKIKKREIGQDELRIFQKVFEVNSELVRKTYNTNGFRLNKKLKKYKN